MHPARILRIALAPAVVATQFLVLSGPAPAASASTAPAKRAVAAGRAEATKQVLPFIDDDLARALAEAKKTNRPVFVESWAPW